MFGIGSSRILGAVVSFLIISGAAHAANNLAVDVTEQVFFSIYQGQTLSNFIAKSKLSQEQKKAFVANIKGYSMTKARLPQTTWKEDSTILTVGEGKNSFTLDFAEIEKNQIKVNNQVVAIPRDALVSEIIGKFKAALSDKKIQKTSSASLFINSAYADDGDDDSNLTPGSLLVLADAADDAKKQGSVYAAGYALAAQGYKLAKQAQDKQKQHPVAAIDQNFPGGAENAKAILSDLAHSDAIDNNTAALMEFNCSKDVFYYTYQYNFIDKLGEQVQQIQKVFINHDNGKVKTVSTQQSNLQPNGRSSDKICHYSYDSKQKYVYIAQDATSAKIPGNQCATVNGELSTTGTSVKRVESCCHDLECRNTLATAIKSGKNANKASKEIKSNNSPGIQ